MAFKQLEELPEDVRQLPPAAQQVFMAAFNTFEENSGNSDEARSVAWNTVKNDYEQGEDGQWHWKVKSPLAHKKGVQGASN